MLRQSVRLVPAFAAAAAASSFYMNAPERVRGGCGALDQPGAQCNLAASSASQAAPQARARPPHVALRVYQQPFCALAPAQAFSASADAAGGSVLTPDAFVDLKLIAKQKLTHNSFSLK